MKKKLLGNFSASDIKVLIDSDFQILDQPLFDYIQSIEQKPVYCFATTTVEAALLRITLEKVHRLYIVNSDRSLLGVVSLTDIMNYFAKS